jgi:hypothetical protein
MLAENTGILAAINADMQQRLGELGQARIAMENIRIEIDRLKVAKSTIAEINRCLKTICANG